MNDLDLAKKIAKEIEKINGRAYFVGGYIRDKLLNRPYKDIDIEVYNLEEEKLLNILNKYSEIIKKGNDFNIYNLKGTNLDFALPRVEKKYGLKHNEFKIINKPYLSLKEATIRRDFRINSIVQDILSEEIIDNYAGLFDLKTKKIRHIDDNLFIEDPLRVLRAARFASELAFDIDDKTIELCQKMDLSHLSKEHIYIELNKALQGLKPSLYFDYLDKMQKLNLIHPELSKLKGIKQNLKNHLEDAYRHTMLVIDKASFYKDNSSNELYFMYGALLHDLGKISAKSDGDIYGIDHEFLANEHIDKFFNNITANKKLIKYTKEVALKHMFPHRLFYKEMSKAECFKFFDSTDIYADIMHIALVDDASRITKDGYRDINQDYQKWLLDILKEYDKNSNNEWINGNDLLSLGYKEKEIGELLEKLKKYKYLYTKDEILEKLKNE